MDEKKMYDEYGGLIYTADKVMNLVDDYDNGRIGIKREEGDQVVSIFCIGQVKNDDDFVGQVKMSCYDEIHLLAAYLEITSVIMDKFDFSIDEMANLVRESKHLVEMKECIEYDQQEMPSVFEKFIKEE